MGEERIDFNKRVKKEQTLINGKERTDFDKWVKKEQTSINR